MVKILLLKAQYDNYHHKVVRTMVGSKKKLQMIIDHMISTYSHRLPMNVSTLNISNSKACLAVLMQPNINRKNLKESSKEYFIMVLKEPQHK